MNLENQKNNVNQNSMISPLQDIITIGTVTLLSLYFFTRGYIHSFNLPIQVNFLESGYFMLTLIADRIFPLVFSFFTNIWLLMIILLVFINSKFKFVKIKRLPIKFMRKIVSKKINITNLTPLEFLLYFMAFIFFITSLLSSDIQIIPRKSNFFCIRS